MSIDDIVKGLEIAIDGSEGDERCFYIALRDGDLPKAKKHYRRLSGYSQRRADEVLSALGYVLSQYD